MQISINNVSHHIPDDWTELLFSDWCDLNKLPKPETEQEKVQYYKDACKIFLGDELKDAKLNDLTQVFNHINRFTQQPEESLLNSEYLRVGDIIYKFSQKTLDVSTKPLEDATFSEFEEANAVMNALSKLNDPEYLIYLAAIFYRPVTGVFKKTVEDFDADNYEQRAELFKYALTMDEVWSCYFFFQSRLSTSVKDTVDYLKKATENLAS